MVTKVTPSAVAWGRLFVGDEIVLVNGTPISGMTQEMYNMLIAAANLVILTVVRGKASTESRLKKACYF